MYFVLLTVLLAFLISGIGVGFALGCRLPNLPDRESRPTRKLGGHD
ncbi:MAG: hypothetical protein ACE5HQ_00315 [Gemmatimonadota bacterium]